MELKTNYQYTYFIHPFVIKEGKYQKYILKMLRDKDFKLKTFQKIVRINVSIIPKNPGREDINNWYATPETIEEVEATQLEQTYISGKESQTGLNINNNHMDNIINGVSSGYGKMKVTGIGSAGDEYTVDSDKDAAEKKYISNNQRYSIYSVMELGKDFIINILTKNIRKNN